MSKPRAICVFLALFSAFFAEASEYGRSAYVPGMVGDFAMAVLPDAPGFYLRSDLSAYTGRNTYTELEGALRVDAELEVEVLIPRLTWVSGWEWLGAHYGAALALPLARVTSEACVELHLPGQTASTRTLSAHQLSFSDFYLTPSIFEWKLGAWDVMWLETLCIPSGTYDSSSVVNASRNYFALNSSLAATWRHPDGGPELDLRASSLVNAENPATHYRTGDELAIDAIAAWRLDARWSLGVAGYAYQQLTGDSGNGAIFGDFKGQAWGGGPLLRYIETVGERRIAWQAKWIHDFEVSRRYQGDLLLLSVSLRW